MRGGRGVGRQVIGRVLPGRFCTSIRHTNKFVEFAERVQ